MARLAYAAAKRGDASFDAAMELATGGRDSAEALADGQGEVRGARPGGGPRSCETRAPAPVGPADPTEVGVLLIRSPEYLVVCRVGAAHGKHDAGPNHRR